MKQADVIIAARRILARLQKKCGESTAAMLVLYADGLTTLEVKNYNKHAHYMVVLPKKKVDLGKVKIATREIRKMWRKI